MLVYAINTIVHTHPEHGAVVQDPGDVFDLADADAKKHLASDHAPIRKPTKNETTLYEAVAKPVPRSWGPADPVRAATQRSAAAAAAAGAASIATDTLNKIVADAVAAHLAANAPAAPAPKGGKGKAAAEATDADLVG